MLRELAGPVARKTPSELCVDNAFRVEPSQPHNFTSVTTSTAHARLPLPPRPRPNHAQSPIAIMSDNENGENGDELVTKPFKFVTGELFPHLRISSFNR